MNLKKIQIGSFMTYDKWFKLILLANSSVEIFRMSSISHINHFRILIYCLNHNYAVYLLNCSLVVKAIIDTNRLSIQLP